MTHSPHPHRARAFGRSAKAQHQLPALAQSALQRIRIKTIAKPIRAASNSSSKLVCSAVDAGATPKGIEQVSIGHLSLPEWRAYTCSRAGLTTLIRRQAWLRRPSVVCRVASPSGTISFKFSKQLRKCARLEKEQRYTWKRVDRDHRFFRR